MTDVGVGGVREAGEAAECEGEWKSIKGEGEREKKENRRDMERRVERSQGFI